MDIVYEDHSSWTNFFPSFNRSPQDSPRFLPRAGPEEAVSGRTALTQAQALLLGQAKFPGWLLPWDAFSLEALCLWQWMWWGFFSDLNMPHCVWLLREHHLESLWPHPAVSIDYFKLATPTQYWGGLASISYPAQTAQSSSSLSSEND